MNIEEYELMYHREENNWWYRGMRKIMFSLIRKYFRNGKILDAGCGTGINMAYLKKYGEVYGVDISEEALEFCKRRGLRNLHKANLSKLPFKDNEFDLVTCFDVLYHKNVNDKEALKEIYRVLKKDGLFISREPAFNFLYGGHDRAVHTRERYDKNTLSKRLKNTGFKIVKISYANMFLFPFVYLLRKFTKKSAKSDTKEIPFFIIFLLYFLLLTESFLIKYFNLPFGVSIISVSKK